MEIYPAEICSIYLGNGPIYSNKAIKTIYALHTFEIAGKAKIALLCIPTPNGILESMEFEMRETES